MAIKNRTWKYRPGIQGKIVSTIKKDNSVKKVTGRSGSTTGLSTATVNRVKKI